MKPNIFLTFFYSGHFPKAPGTAGTLLAAIIGVPIIWYVSLETLFLLTVLFIAIGVKQINLYEANGGEHDDKRIVIDEVVGVWLALILSSQGILQVIFSVIFFRIFDIWKPSFIGKIDREVKGGIGVIGDDLLAGVVAGICSAALYQFILNIAKMFS